MDERAYLQSRSPDGGETLSRKAPSKPNERRVEFCLLVRDLPRLSIFVQALVGIDYSCVLDNFTGRGRISRVSVSFQVLRNTELRRHAICEERTN